MLLRILGLGIVYLLGYSLGFFLFVFSMAMIGQGAGGTLAVLLLVVFAVVTVSSVLYFKRGNNSSLTS